MHNRPLLKTIQDWLQSPEFPKETLTELFAIVADISEEAILLGAIAFYAEKLRRSNPNPETNPVLTQLEQGLITFHQAANEQRFINLMRFYQWVKDNDQLEFLINHSQKKWLQEIEGILKHVLKHSTERVTILTHSLPDLALFKARLSHLNTEYEQKLQQRWFKKLWCDDERLHQIAFINFIQQMLDEVKQKYPIAAEKERDILAGAVVVVLLWLYEDCSYLPPLSFLFQHGLALLNLPHLHAMDDATKEELLRAADDFLQTIKKDESYQARINEAKKKFDFEGYILKIDHFIVQVKERQLTPITNPYVVNTLKKAVHFGVSYAATTFAGTFFATSLGPFGFLATTYARAPVSALLSCISQMVDRNLTGLAINSIATVFQTFIKHKDLKDEDQTFINEWIECLLLAPSTIVSEDIKNQIRYVVNEQCLQDLQTMTMTHTYKKCL